MVATVRTVLPTYLHVGSGLQVSHARQDLSIPPGSNTNREKGPHSNGQDF